MSGNYLNCSECGKRALRIATRCPGCGREFSPAPPTQHRSAGGLSQFLVPLMVTGAAAALVAAGAAAIERVRTRPAPPVSVAVVRSDTEAAEVPQPATPVDRRYARTWTKVRTGRSTTADLAAVLLPGDTVLVDSLAHGWWRVTLEGEVIGYSHRSTLDTVPPPIEP